MNATKYRVQVFTRSEQRVSRHGIYRSVGGVLLWQGPVLDLRDTPTYISEEQAREEFPGADVFIKAVDQN